VSCFESLHYRSAFPFITSLELHAIALALATWRTPHQAAASTERPEPAAYDVQAESSLPPEARDSPSVQTLRGSSNATHAGASVPHPKANAPPGLPPPTAARASEVMTQSSVTEETKVERFVTGMAPTYAGGVTQPGATSDVAVHDEDARAWGMAGGAGTGGGGGWGDRSRPASLGGDKEWHCPFPQEADAVHLDHAIVRVGAEVDARGRALRVVVIDDPGYGFAREAIPCAMAERYVPALDKNGVATRGRTRPFRVVFDRW
jgi:periplasmic protein TonB